MAKITVTIEAADWNEARQIMCDATGGHIAAAPAPKIDLQTFDSEPEKTEAPKPAMIGPQSREVAQPAEVPEQSKESAPAPIAAAPETGDSKPAPAGVETDKNGLPWDARIHSGSKNKIADGSWRKKKGVEPDVVEQVEQELRALMALPAVAEPAAPATPTPSVFADNDASAAFGGIPEAPKPEIAAPAPVTAAVPPATTGAETVTTVKEPATVSTAEAPEIRTIADLMGLVLSKKLSNDAVMSVLQKHGIQALPLLGARPDLIPAVAADLQAL